ncbi:MAG: ABC transporter permease [Acidimicrobiaceae bacterium]
MSRYVSKRVLLSLATLLLVSFIVFIAGDVLPGSIGRTILGQFATDAQVHAVDVQLGFNHPVLIRYWNWISSFVTGDWGTSITQQIPVLSFVMQKFLNSLMLGAFALIIIVPISVGLGVLAAVKRNTKIDKIISITGMSMLALPEFVTGVGVIILFSLVLKWFPVFSNVPGWNPWQIVRNFFLPAMPEMLLIFGYISRIARAGTIEALESNYNRTAVLKGLPPSRILARHILRNSLLPTIAVTAVQAGYLVGGLVVVETLFNYPGIGNLIYTSATQHDQPVLQASVFLVALIYTVGNLVADLLTAWLNPRVRLA